MKKSALLAITSFFILTPASSFAQLGQSTEDRANEYALKETQKLLRNREKREEVMRNDPHAAQANKGLQNLTGGNADLDQATWELAADLMPLLAEKGENDPKKMTEYLQQMQRNPAAFAEQFSGPQKAKLKALAEKIQKAQKNQKP